MYILFLLFLDQYCYKTHEPANRIIAGNFQIFRTSKFDRISLFLCFFFAIIRFCSTLIGILHLFILSFLLKRRGKWACSLLFF